MDSRDGLVYRMQAEIIKALAHPIRLAILNTVKDGEKCVCDIAIDVGAGRPNVSRHLAIMTKAGVLSCRKEGLMVFYQLRCPCVLGFLQCATRVLKQNVKEEAKLLTTV